MANQYVDLTGGYNAEAKRIQRERELAQLLSQQGQQPIEVMRGSNGYQAPISWASILAKGLQGLGGGLREYQADKAEKKLSEADREAAANLLRQMSGEDNKALGARPIAPQTMDISGPAGMPGGAVTAGGSQGPGGVVNTPPSQSQMLAMLLGAEGGPKTDAIRNAMLPRVFADQDYQRQRGDRRADVMDERAYEGGLAGTKRSQALEDDTRNFQQSKDLAAFQNQMPMTAYQQQSLANQRAQTEASRNNQRAAPQGYEWKPDGTMQVIKGGPADSTGAKSKATDSQRITALFADRAKEANRIVSQPTIEGASSSLGQRAKASIPGIGNYMVSEDYQKADQAKRDFINAVLRKESGAVIGADEFANAELQYFAQPGDTSAVKAQKRANRDTAINGLTRAAGTALDERPMGQAAATKVVNWSDLP